MANLRAINSFGNSLVNRLQDAYELFRDSTVEEWPDCSFSLFSSHSFENVDNLNNTLSCFLYRVTINEHLRSNYKINSCDFGKVPLPLDLHFLLTVWANEPLAEHLLLSWAMRHLHLNPIWDTSFLDSDAAWRPGEMVQIYPEELSNEDMMRIWDTLKPSYRLSVSYVARVVRVEPDRPLEGLPRVVATRYGWEDSPEAIKPNHEEVVP